MTLSHNGERGEPGITGGAIQNLLSGGNFVIIIVIFTGLFALVIISKTIIKLKKK